MARPRMGDEIPEARASKKAKPTLDHIEIHPSLKPKGHIVRHVFNSQGPYVEPKDHTFKATEGHKMVAHIIKHAGIEGVAMKGGGSKGDADTNMEMTEGHDPEAPTEDEV